MPCCGPQLTFLSLLDISTWMSSRHLKVSMCSTKSWAPLLQTSLLTAPVLQSLPCQTWGALKAVPLLRPVTLSPQLSSSLFLRRPFAPWPLCSSSKYAVKYFLFLIIGRGDGSLGEWIKRGRESEREREREGEKLLPVKMVWISTAQGLWNFSFFEIGKYWKFYSWLYCYLLQMLLHFINRGNFWSEARLNIIL